MNLNPLVSIIIPLYNAEKYIAEAIESVLGQTYKNIEVIIVNDGSTDNSLGVAKTHEKENVKIYDQPNRGASASRNYGLLKSNGEYVKFFDADDLMNPEMIEAQINLALRNPDSLISSKWCRFYDNDINLVKSYEREYYKDLSSMEWIITAWKDAKPMHQSGIFLIRKETINRAGLWDETLSKNDDMEFFTRIILSNKNVVFSESSMLYYRSGLGNSTLSASKSKKAIESHFTSVYKSVSYILDTRNDAVTKLLVANMWQMFVYDNFLLDTHYSRKSIKIIKDFGGSDLKIHGGRRLLILTNLIGWRLALSVEKIIKAKS